MLGLLVLLVLVLLFVLLFSDLVVGMKYDLFMFVLWLSIRTIVFSLVIVVLLGTLLVWWLVVVSFCRRCVVELLVDLFIVLFFVVMGIVLFQIFG